MPFVQFTADRTDVLIRYRPPPPLDVAIDCIWLSHRSESSPECEHMLPSGKAHLVIALHDVPVTWTHAKDATAWQTWKCGVAHGPQTSYYLAGPKPEGTVVGVSFRPGMAGAVLGVPLSEMQNRHISLEELWGHGGCELHDRLAATVNPPTIFHLLENELMARMRRPLLLHPAVAYALGASVSGCEHHRVFDIQRHTGYSPRHFIELFRSAVGITPKQYYRIRRFSSALTRLAAQDARLAEVAASTGYADQAHFSREFRELAGIAPSSYRPRSADSAHHHVATPPK